MKTINIPIGTHIEHAAALLVANAPACADFSGITVRARYATTRPADVVAHFRRICDERTYRYRCSPKGKRAAEQDALEVAEREATMDRLLAALPDFSDVPSVLSWVEAASEAADRVGVSFDRNALRAAFSSGGWGVGVNCDEDFDGDDARNFAGWIVGQWLHIWHPGLTPHFIGQWREKFQRSAA